MSSLCAASTLSDPASASCTTSSRVEVRSFSVYTNPSASSRRNIAPSRRTSATAQESSSCSRVRASGSRGAGGDGALARGEARPARRRAATRRRLILLSPSEHHALAVEARRAGGMRRCHLGDLERALAVVATYRQGVLSPLERPVVSPDHPGEARQRGP